MNEPLVPAWADVPQPVIGMLHLKPLPGSPKFGGDLAVVRESLLRDAAALVEGGIHGLIIENFGDVPFFPKRVPAYVVAHMTRLAHEVRARYDVPLGINVLRNDGLSALAVAHAVGAAFIRVNVLCGARVADQGILEGIAHELSRERAALDADGIKVFADVSVKHSAPLGPESPLEQQVADTIERGQADAVVVSGSGTGQPTDQSELKRAKSAAGDTPVFVGSGVTPETIAELAADADGFIVGTGLKVDGVATNAVDSKRVIELMRRLI
jgi:hypothetical protein